MTESTAASHTTAVLLVRARGGDDAARTRLVQRMEPLLRRFAQGRVPGLLRHRSDTADLIQTTWLRVLQRLGEIRSDHPGDFFAYLRVVLVNALRESLRGHARSPAEQLPATTGGLAVELLPAQAVPVEDWVAYEQSLARLDPATRAVALMRFEFGMGFAEIAAELSESADGVRMKLKRAIERMAAWESSD